MMTLCYVTYVNHVIYLFVYSILKFCTRNGLHPSIKAGGYGTAGWSINGDVVIDLSKLKDLQIEAPNATGGCNSLRETPPLNAKGKERLDIVAPGLGEKRRRTSDNPEQTELPRNELVANFLHPGAGRGAQPSPAIRRRVDFDREVASLRPRSDERSVETKLALSQDMSREDSSESVDSKGSTGTPGSELSAGKSTASTSATSAGAPDRDEPDSGVKDSLASLGLNPSAQERRDAADILAAAPAGVYDSLRATSRLIAPDLDVETPRAEAPAPQFTVRSSDPFSYMSGSKPSSGAPLLPSVRPQQGSYVQSTYARRPQAESGSAGSSARPMSGELSTPMASPFLANSSPGSMFMSSVIGRT